MEAQCFTCVDSYSYQYYGVKHNGKEMAERYIAAYEEMGRPIVECYSCGAQVKYTQQEDGRWQQVYVEGA